MRLFFVMPLFICFHSFGQHLSINDNFYTQNSSGEFNVYLEGNASFTDSMLVVYSVTTADTLQQVLLSDSVDFRSTPVAFPENFLYNAIDSTLRINLGTYSTKELILVLYSEINGERQETIYINIPTFEAALENEE